MSPAHPLLVLLPSLHVYSRLAACLRRVTLFLAFSVSIQHSTLASSPGSVHTQERCFPSVSPYGTVVTSTMSLCSFTTLTDCGAEPTNINGIALSIHHASRRLAVASQLAPPNMELGSNMD